MQLPEAGEAAAHRRWQEFLEAAVNGYDGDRDRPDHAGTSRMSPYLKWGCIHPRTLLADLASLKSSGAASYRRELAWREFYADVVHHLPKSLWTSVDPVIDAMSWDDGTEADERFVAWQQGRTGYPYIDAGMRQLLAEGWMHNRVRMGVASFLIKDLHLPWQWGAKHFMEHLVDGDYASNNHGWQWVAGSGPQASPFFRIFNPLAQGEKFDPQGDYVRHVRSGAARHRREGRAPALGIDRRSARRVSGTARRARRRTSRDVAPLGESPPRLRRPVSRVPVRNLRGANPRRRTRFRPARASAARRRC